jgi:transcription elongation factor Elf1
MLDQRRGCIHQGHIFYSEDLSDQVIAKSICAKCPVFQSCAVWSLHGDLDQHNEYYGISAGMSPDQRRRIREGRERFWDWRRDFNYVQRAAKAAARKREHDGIRKRERRREEMPLCPDCESNENIQRVGRNKITNRQRYQCTTCGSRFEGEEL